MNEIEIHIHLNESAQPKTIKIAEDATVEQLVKEIQAAGAAIGESGDEIVLWVENKEIVCRKGQKIHECGIKHGHHLHYHRKKIKVTVAYTGHDDYEGEFSPEESIGTVKRKAMHQFDIEESAADKYVLQHDNVNLDDKIKVGALGKCDVKLVLLLKQPQEKGYAG
jgi:uncharacterized protein YacL (UPF0231 family)